MKDTSVIVDELFDILTSTYHENIIDILVYLADGNNSYEISHKARKLLEEAGLCIYCGEKLQKHAYKQYHNELQGCPWEDIEDVYCPNCDI